MRFLLVLLFIVVPIAELAVIIQVGGWIGVWPTIAILIADSLLGSFLMRSQGRVAWRRFNLAVQEGRPPAREVADGALIIFGGALLLTPGFLTDILGILLLLPPTRAIVRRTLVRTVARRMAASVTSFSVRAGGAPGADPQNYDVDGTATDVDQERLRP
jgi:UPF0716 protein FxsA